MNTIPSHDVIHRELYEAWRTTHDEHCTNVENCSTFGHAQPCHHPPPAVLATRSFTWEDVDVLKDVLKGARRANVESGQHHGDHLLALMEDVTEKVVALLPPRRQWPTPHPPILGCECPACLRAYDERFPLNDHPA